MQIQKIIVDNKFNPVLIKQIHEINSCMSYNSIWQTIEWNLMQQNAWYIDSGFFVWVFEENILKNYVIIEKRLIWGWKFGNFIIWWIINNYWLEELENEIIKIWKDEKVIFTQIENLEELDFKNFSTWFYKAFIEKYTAVVDLQKTEEEILTNMKQKGRYNIKVAQKNWVEIKKVDNNEMNLDIFYNLLSETKDRDDFSVNSKNFFKEFLNYIYKNNIWWLYFAIKDEEIIASWIFIFYWKTCLYYYWASTSDNSKRKFMATYLLQWFVITEAKLTWCEIFDFLGIANPEDKNSHLAWVTDFKLKLTNNIKKFPDSRIYIHKKIMFAIFKIIKKIKVYFK